MKTKYLDKKLIFLAGATGLAGASIIKHIINSCPTTRIRASFWHTKPFIRHKRVEYIKGNLKSLADCRRMSKGCDCAIMAAAYTGGAQFTASNKLAHMKENLLMNVIMLEAFYREKIKRIVYVGSATVYQNSGKSIRENGLDLNNDPDKAYFGFAWGGRFTEKLCQFFHEQYGMEIVIARAANIFGPYARFNPKTSNFIPAIIRKAVDKMEPFEVWGSPGITRDVIYADDFARAIIMLLADNKIKFDVFNVGSGVKTTVRQVVEWALKYAQHKPLNVKYVQNMPKANKFRALDCSKIKARAGWQPQYSIEEGIKKTVEWWVDNKRCWKK